MIIVKKASVEKMNEKVLVRVPIEIDDEKKALMFTFGQEYEKYLTVDRGDAFLVMLFYYAMSTGHDMTFEMPISARILYQVKNNLIKALHREKSEFKDINIHCDITDEVYEKGKAIGTGISCGVDSLSSVFFHNYKLSHDNYKITQFTFFKAGAFNYGDGMEVMNTDGSNAYDTNRARSQRFANEMNIPLLMVDSNIAEIAPFPHELVDATRNNGIVLLFQKLFSVYYYSSTYNLNEFVIGPDKYSGFYEIYILPNISTDNITFYSAMSAFDRFEKTEILAEFDKAHEYLSLCTTGSFNCGVCAKCTYTLLTLDIIGKLELFKDVFDLKKYEKTRAMQIGYAIASRKETYYFDIYPRLIKSGKIPMKSWLYVIGFKIVKPIEFYMRSLSPDRKRKLVAFAKKHNMRVPF